jgi:hypothetical protein
MSERTPHARIFALSAASATTLVRLISPVLEFGDTYNLDRPLPQAGVESEKK